MNNKKQTDFNNPDIIEEDCYVFYDLSGYLIYFKSYDENLEKTKRIVWLKSNGSMVEWKAI